MSILKKPVVTEKGTQLQDKLNQYTFMVDPKADKLEIKAEIEKIYEVTVEEVRTMNYKGKSKTRFTKRNFISGRTPALKKAIVKLKDGDQIDFYSNI
ncbi:MAG: 50S ribosomal protein L23 [Bacteroidota bacterium]|nr:50S ribosomal protein L23 [Bacteroidota bacterium]